MIDTLQINKFSDLHDGKNIIFCKTDFLLQEFEYIKTLPNEVILISGNSDYVIDENIYKYKPDNVKSWYAQNPMFTNEIIKALPIGIENKLPAYRDGHGIGWGHRVQLKENVINSFEDKSPTKLIYANFRVETNLEHRNLVRDICISSKFIDWEEPYLSVDNFMYKILDYEAVVCAQGNGDGDNHRIYETLYMNRIPITFNVIMYRNLHHNFPVVFLENLDMLKDEVFVRQKILEAKNKNWDKSILTTEFWKNKIVKTFHGNDNRVFE